MIVVPGVLDVGLLLLRLALGALLLLAAQSKFAYRKAEFVAMLDSYRVIPKSLYWVGIYLVPRIEAFLALGLLLGVQVPVFGWAAAGLLVVYTGLIILAIVKRVDADCNCFGSMFQQKLGWPIVVRNLVLIGLAVVLTITGAPVFGIDSLKLTLNQSWLFVAALVPLALFFQSAESRHWK